MRSNPAHQLFFSFSTRLRLSLASQKGLTIGEKRKADKISEETEKKDESFDVDGEDSKKKCRIM